MVTVCSVFWPVNGCSFACLSHLILCESKFFHLCPSIMKKKRKNNKKNMHKRGLPAFRLVDTLLWHVFCYFLHFFPLVTENDQKTCFSVKNVLDQQTACGALICWLKYTTTVLACCFHPPLIPVCFHSLTGILFITSHN